jgi:hypothetical protein
VLICEPHDDIRALLDVVVRRLGHEPVSLNGAGPDQLAVDAAVIEPGEPEGLRLARQLRSRGVPVLFTSIFPANPELLELAPTAYLVKPFPLYVLERALAETLSPEATPTAAAI